VLPSHQLTRLASGCKSDAALRSILSSLLDVLSIDDLSPRFLQDCAWGMNGYPSPAIFKATSAVTSDMGYSAGTHSEGDMPGMAALCNTASTYNLPAN
jgi:hypothetical protein